MEKSLCYNISNVLLKKKNPLFVSLFGFIWSNREKIGKSLGTWEGFCPIFISCSWQCHLKLHPFALAIKLLNHNRQENNGSFSFCFHLPRFLWEIGTFSRRTATWNSLANNQQSPVLLCTTHLQTTMFTLLNVWLSSLPPTTDFWKLFINIERYHFKICQ